MCMENQYQACTRCVMDTKGNLAITFDKNGVCNYCTFAVDYMKKMYFPNKEGKQRLDKMFEQIKTEGKGHNFDCAVGLSGGVDSSYLVYLGHQYGLRILAVHVDDGYDTDVTTKNIESICKAAKAHLVVARPDAKQFNDLTLSFLKAGVSNLAMPQDNILFATLHHEIKRHKIRYCLNGSNLALESILGHAKDDDVDANDSRHIKEIHKRFGTQPIHKLHFLSTWQKHFLHRFFNTVQVLKPLNYIDYRLEKALADMEAFSGYTYYGGKHWESILTRFLQCYYLPVKFGIDKRKSHFSSLIVSGQMTREEALKKLEVSPYLPDRLEQDKRFLASNMGISVEELDCLVAQPPKKHLDYPRSRLTSLVSFARKTYRRAKSLPM